MSGFSCRFKKGTRLACNSGSRSRIELRVDSCELVSFPLPTAGCELSLSVRSSSGTRFLACSRLARLGNTPPNSACSAACEMRALPRIFHSNAGPKSPFASSKQTAVSSQDVSIPKMRIARLWRIMTDYEIYLARRPPDDEESPAVLPLCVKTPLAGRYGGDTPCRGGQRFLRERRPRFQTHRCCGGVALHGGLR